MAQPAPPSPSVRAWRPAVPGITEVFHARFPEHAYPPHTHSAWTLLIVDAGLVRYDLARREHGAQPIEVTLLPPHVPHDGRHASAGGFRKRVLYLDEPVLGSALIGRAVDQPELRDPLLRNRIHELHRSLALPGEEFEAQSRLALIVERLRGHHATPGASLLPDDRLAGRLRELLDANLRTGLGLEAAAATLQRHPTHLVRAFSRAYGIPPHRYLIGRRIDNARRLLLEGARPAWVAAETGFFDQAHLHRHFVAMLGVSPAAYARAFPGGPA